MPRPEISSILKTLQIPSKQHSVYLVGSRLWGTHSEAHSDFDLLVVIADTPASFPKSQHKGQYDVTIMTEAAFREQVASGALLETLCCLIPDTEECVLVNGGEHERRALIGKKQLATMWRWAEDRERKDREKAMKFWAKGGEMREKGYKILKHVITAGCILQGLKTIIEEDKIDLRDIQLTRPVLQQFVARGREENDREWLALDWAGVQEVYTGRIQGLRAVGAGS